MELQIVHETCYDYAPVVETAQHIAYLRPPDTATQRVLAHDLHIDPAPASASTSTDIYGNHRTFFTLLTPHSALCVTARSTVVTEQGQEGVSTVLWETLRESFRYHAGAPWSAATEFSFGSPRAPRQDEFAAYARDSFAPGMSALEAVRDLMRRIHEDFEYESLSTEVHTPALEALQQRKGVCQDFAHIMLACVRSMGLAARYVSGYLLTHPPPGQPRLIGSDASHAWISVFLPDLDPEDESRCWYDLDPTNVRDGWLTPGDDYIVLATGRDYGDVSPMRGVIHGGAQHTLDVAVTVAPVGEDTAAA